MEQKLVPYLDWGKKLVPHLDWEKKWIPHLDWGDWQKTDIGLTMTKIDGATRGAKKWFPPRLGP